MEDRIEELTSASSAINYIIKNTNDENAKSVLKTALSSMLFELEFCFDLDMRSQELPEGW